MRSGAFGKLFFRFGQFDKDARSSMRWALVAVLAAASTGAFDQAFAAANASTLISTAGFVERKFRRFNASTI